MQRFSGMTISRQAGIFITAIVATVCAVFMIAYATISSSLRRQNDLYTAQTLTQVRASIEEKTDTLEGILQSVGYDKNVAVYLYRTDAAERYEAYTQITGQVRRLSVFMQDIRFFFAVGENGVSYFSSGRRDYYDAAFGDLPHSTAYYYAFLDASDSGQTDIAGAFVVTLPLYDLWGTTTLYDLGRIALVVSCDYLTIADFEGAYGMGLYLLDRDLTVRSRSAKTAVPESIADRIIVSLEFSPEGGACRLREDGETYIVQYLYQEEFEGYLLSVTPESAIEADAAWLRSTILWMLVCLVVMLALMLRGMHRVVTAPLLAFAERLRTFRTEGGEQEIHLTGCAEIETISAEFNRMLAREDALGRQLAAVQENLYKTILLKKNTELAWLKSRLNPHFLYNTLETGIGLAYTENAPKTVETLKSLSRILCYSVKGEEWVPLRRELEIVRAYLTIQETRFSGAFEVRWEVAEDVLDVRLPKMLLQPIVENAVVHGLEPKGAGTLTVSAARQGGTLRLGVADDGAGMDAETLASMRRTFAEGAGGGASAGDEGHRGIGVANVADRLHLLCGEGAEAQVESAPGQGCRITLVIPLRD